MKKIYKKIINTEDIYISENKYNIFDYFSMINNKKLFFFKRKEYLIYGELFIHEKDIDGTIKIKFYHLSLLPDKFRYMGETFVCLEQIGENIMKNYIGNNSFLDIKPSKVFPFMNLITKNLNEINI